MITCEAVNVEDCIVAETRGAHLRCETDCAYAMDNPACLREKIAALRAALELIRDSNNFAGGSSLKEVQGIARAALAGGAK